MSNHEPFTSIVPGLFDPFELPSVPVLTNPSSAIAEVQVDSIPTYSSVEKPLTTRVWGTDFAHVNMQQTLELIADSVEHRRPQYMITANVNYLMLTEQYPRLRDVNARSLAVIADGNPIVWRSKLTACPLPTRVAGSDLIIEVARLAADHSYRIFFLGAAPGVARAAATTLQHSFPNLQVAGCYSPPFRALTQAEHQQMIDTIRTSRTDILLVAFGQPKGELWIYDHLMELNVPMSIQLGASFDFLAGTAKRAPEAWQRLGCEWLYRTLQDPQRLTKRYASNALYLAKQLFLELLGMKQSN
ncbi:MAG: WecB/TagA/CpsF family glycosyltransferase [Planctomycetales bacterium]|nr:WecB/TagA/CpsF family glycosyltransferase [Planctomycetales bacterium]